MEPINNFLAKITNFQDLDPSAQIKYFVYFITIVEGNEWTQPKTVLNCFNDLRLPIYSNVSSFLSRKSKKPNQLFIFNKKLGYGLTAAQREVIESEIGKQKNPKPTNDLLDLSRFESTRGYLQSVASEINLCYDTTAYTACAVLIRRIVETLIIEAYEHKCIETNIKDKNGDYQMFSGLVQSYIQEKALSPSRAIKKNLPLVKRLGDNAAHNKKFIASKKDIDEFKTEILMTISELLATIDYPNWK